jgi:ATP-dependent DNA ligase
LAGPPAGVTYSQIRPRCRYDARHVDALRHACKMFLEGIVSKRLSSRYVSGRSSDWLKTKNPAAPAVKREAEEDWARWANEN